MTNKTLSVCILAFVAAGVASSADVYRQVDDAGNVIYSDRPADAGAERLKLSTGKTDPAAVAARREALTQAQAGRAAAREQAAAKQAQDRDRAEQRAANCEKARAYQQRVTTAHRLYEVDQNGERQYYSTQQHEAALARARDQVQEWCDTDGS